MSYSEDTDWLFRMMFSTQWQVEGIAQVLMWYRTNRTGLSSDLYRMEEGWNRLINKAREYAPELVNRHSARATNLRYPARRAFRLRYLHRRCRFYDSCLAIRLEINS